MHPSTKRGALTGLMALMALGAEACGGAEPRRAHPIFSAPVEEVDSSGDEGGESPVARSGDGETRARIGEAGGSLSLGTGAKLEVPEGALAETVEIVLSRGAVTRAFENKEDEKAIGPLFLVEPALTAQPGTRFVVSVPFSSIPDGFSESDLAIAWEEAATQRSLGMGGQQTRWTYGPARRDGARIVAEVAQLSGMRLQFVVSR